MIMGVVMVSSSIALGNGDNSRMRRSVEELLLEANYLSQKSVLSSKSYSVTISALGIDLWVYEDGGWVPFSEEGLPHHRSWPLEGVKVSGSLSHGGRVSLFFFPDGMGFPADLVIRSPVSNYHLTSDFMGNVTVNRE
nr:hypothetical protein [Candidatus Ichthyocystis sparus]